MTEPIQIDGRTYVPATSAEAFSDHVLQHAETRAEKAGGVSVWLSVTDSVVARREADGRLLIRVVEP